MTATVFVVDDDAVMRDALAGLLKGAGMQVEAFADGPAFLSACGKESTGCVVLDMAMPGMSGEEVHEELQERGLPLSVVFLSGHGDVPMAVRAVQNGAVDFLEKPILGEVLLERVRAALALNEQRIQAHAHAQRIRQSYARLSPREREVMAMVVSGLSSKEIAQQLGLSPRTVEVHRVHVMYKMGAGNLAELVKMAAHCQT